METEKGWREILFNLNSAVGTDVGAQDIEMPRLEDAEGLIDRVIRPRRLNALALKRLQATTEAYNRS